MYCLSGLPYGHYRPVPKFSCNLAFGVPVIFVSVMLFLPMLIQRPCCPYLGNSDSMTWSSIVLVVVTDVGASLNPSKFVGHTSRSNCVLLQCGTYHHGRHSALNGKVSPTARCFSTRVTYRYRKNKYARVAGSGPTQTGTERSVLVANSLTAQAFFFNHSGTAESDNTIVTVYGSWSYPSVSQASWLTGLSRPNHEDTYHTFASTGDLHLASSTPWRGCRIKHRTVDECSPYETRDPINEIHQSGQAGRI